MKSARLKYPINAGTFFFLISLPFILGIKIPSIHEGDFYTLIYVILNFPVIYMFGSFSDKIAIYFFTAQPTQYQANIVLILFAHFFWIGLAFIAGFFIDQKRLK